MRRFIGLFLIAVFTLSLCAAGLSAREAPYMLVRVDVSLDVKVVPLLELGLDIVDGIKDQYVEVVCHPDDLARIRALGYRADVRIVDMDEHYAALSPTDDMGGFRTYVEVVVAMDSIHTLYPNITSEVFSIGQSIEGRELYAMKISDNPELEEDEPEIFFNGLTHAREPIGMTICMALIDSLTRNYGSDPFITDMVDNREIYFLPVVNPDGYVYNEQTSPSGGGMWRKNRRDNGGSFGVDLNRNYGFNWGYNNIGSSGSPSSETYRGTAPFSEPETEAVRQFCNLHQFALAQNFHSYSDLMLYSWSIPDPPWGYTPDDATFQMLSATMQQWTGYVYGTAWEILYEVNGDANDWMYGEQVEKPKTLAWVFEVGSTFWPSPSSIPGLVAENIEPAYFMIEQAENYMPTPVNLAYLGGIIDDSAGNGNGGLDPGEAIIFTPTLRNNGWETGTGISAELICGDPYITVTSNNSTYPNLDPHTSGEAITPYTFDVSPSSPLEYTVQFGLLWTCNEGYSDTAQFTLMIGDPLFQPMGPDGYGYMAYDNYDEAGPEFNWIEIDPSWGGPGTLINYTQDDETFTIPLPFTFQYYGETYNEISVCGNGWIAMGTTTETDYSNSAIPDDDGPPAMIAPFWEDLSPQDVGQVAYYYDAANNYFIVEFDSVRQYLPTSALETFEVILYDPAHYPTTTGDGQILFQYNQISDPSANTIGIENHTETIGLQLLYNGDLDSHVPWPEPGVAVLFTTPTSIPDLTVTLTPVGLPIQIPTTGGSFDFNIEVANNEPGSQPFTAWCDVTLPTGGTFGPVIGPVDLTLPGGGSIDRDRTQDVPAGAPAGMYSYNAYAGIYPDLVWATDSFDFEKLATGDGEPVSGWNNSGEPFEVADGTETVLPDEFVMLGAYPNPFNPTTTIAFTLPQSGKVLLSIYDVSGRLVAALTEGHRTAGMHEVTFDGSNFASGIYIYRLEAGQFAASGKMVLMK